MRQVELLADLAVRQPVGGHLGYLERLRRELVARVGCPPVAALTGGSELLPCTIAPRQCSDRVEQRARGSEHVPGFDDTALASQPDSERELQAAAVERPELRFSQRRCEEIFCGLVTQAPPSREPSRGVMRLNL